ncbi:hypothetical protein [Endozoicomonas sp. SCSIO W0465]|uniref:hypothetical protein n=1 Tax=Endozoicomonas sp. SCSIO W0465 TaxID=2918516 RepID=UPI002075A973|nr:hypothetical protein [Endozoicomonas sp. SCSIO W0465]USE38063.1 hypothetical protein MJO57_07765 [Endozoicomonas sp. SCSIO W0465]
MQLDTITLPDDLLWINEFEWNPVEQTTERSLTGALLVQEGQFNYGRPIVLSGNGEAGWVSRLTVKSLFALSETVSKTMTLTLPDNRQFSVIFDRSNGAPVEAQQLMPFAYPDDSDQYLLTLRLLTVH